MNTPNPLVVQDEYAELTRRGAIAQDQPIELVDGPRLGLHLFTRPDTEGVSL